MKALSSKLVRVIKAVGGKVAKSGLNNHQKYKYVMENDLLEVISPELVKEGILVTMSVEDVTKEGDITTVRTKHTIIDSESGEYLEVFSAGQGHDKQDKGVFKALTGANKYFFSKTFQVAGDDDPEKSEDTGKGQSKSFSSTKPATKAATNKVAPASTGFGTPSAGSKTVPANPFGAPVPNKKVSNPAPPATNRSTSFGKPSSENVTGFGTMPAVEPQLPSEGDLEIGF